MTDTFLLTALIQPGLSLFHVLAGPESTSRQTGEMPGQVSGQGGSANTAQMGGIPGPHAAWQQ